MTTASDRRLRADAVRNVGRILRAASRVYAERGPDAPLDEVARFAGVGARTLYRHFPTKEHLVRAALDFCVVEDLTPAIEKALAEDDPRRGLQNLMEASLRLSAREFNLLAAARSVGALPVESAQRFYDSLNELVCRAQRSGQIRDDLVAEDLPRIMAMMFGVVSTLGPGTDGWQRYLAIILEGLASDPTIPLPPPAKQIELPRRGSWPM
ncbi:AcrR family transcriptional regulator [Mycolicibacterium sp. BK556]|jgi:AcrR family transcriptional regulator|uniref:TetR/AcrR family transcriptional regulator n=1 Tax=Mycobacteriaceae TaxID=1762 RepID=UPI000D3B2580|nr:MULTISPECIES: TetR/AcrR family transcriptional regulator [Mycobacteriaceae]MBB3606469.1 AcrR family transcriptional regulator [Mycolicibacterium sp. BK556]MBB3636285.1 AcrR family transcriptional regulator [Mycolicibacterium sp. BK607]MBB3753576.1 AcrR family transcriptional regulator [Mycolicibacterium sp. BK634]TDO06427.1 TetR family transcriptional regulator [Mycobacterium sp. BK086]